MLYSKNIRYCFIKKNNNYFYNCYNVLLLWGLGSYVGSFFLTDPEYNHSLSIFTNQI